MLFVILNDTVHKQADDSLALSHDVQCMLVQCTLCIGRASLKVGSIVASSMPYTHHDNTMTDCGSQLTACCCLLHRRGPFNWSLYRAGGVSYMSFDVGFLKGVAKLDKSLYDILPPRRNK